MASPLRLDQLEDAVAAEVEHADRTPADISFAPSFVRAVPLRQQEVPTVDLAEHPIDPAVADLIPRHLSARHGLIGIAIEDSRIVVAMSDPGNVIAIDDVRAITGLEVKVVQAPRQDIAEALNRIVPVDDPVAGAVAAAELDVVPDAAALGAVVEDAPIIRLVNVVIARAVTARASDIHIEPNESDVRIRYRIDGVLHEQMRVGRSILPGIVSRIKIVSEMDIAERRVPQDGRAEVTVAGLTADLRVATLPTMFGEKVVIRILDKSHASRGLGELGLSAHTAERYSRAFRRPQGMILVTGPTGSGKTTTLYATLNSVSAPENSVITVEDPVEYGLPGAYQVQVSPKAGLTFASALRSILRTDPDIVLVGEIRDRETAQLAIDAALTGHLVLSSLHTNDAPSALARLVEMGVESFLVASAVDCVLGQRLVRVLCDRCREPSEPSPEALAEAGVEIGSAVVWRPVGCVRCGDTGYRGRTGVHETMIMSEEIERLTVERRPSEEIARLAREQGMRTLWDDALDKVRAGVTSLEEVLRVVGSPRRQQGGSRGTAAPAQPAQPPPPPPPQPPPPPRAPVAVRVGGDGKIRVRLTRGG